MSAKQPKRMLTLVVAVATVAVAMPAVAGAREVEREPVVHELTSFAAPGCVGGCGSGSTIGPDGALYVTDGPAGRVLRVDPETGATSTFASGLPPAIPAVGIGGAMDVAFAALGSRAGRPSLEPRRFRPNLLLEATDGEPFAEDTWIGATVRVGGLAMRVDRRDERCVVVNVDPRTADRDPAVLRAIARARQACLGVYGTTVEPGRVALGDVVSVEHSNRRGPQLE